MSLQWSLSGGFCKIKGITNITVLSSKKQVTISDWYSKNTQLHYTKIKCRTTGTTFYLYHIIYLKESILPFQNTSGYNDFLNLRSSFVNLSDFRIAHHSLHVVLFHETISTMNLNRLNRLLHCHFGCVQFSHR